MLRRSRTHCADEGGFSLMEAVVAAVVLGLFSAAVATFIAINLKTSESNRQRVSASSLAAREMEIARQQFAASDAGALAVVGAGAVTNPDPLSTGNQNVVNGVNYTVQRTAAWAPTGNASSACDGGGQISYPSVRLTVTVTWPNMGSVAPVVNESIVTPSKQLLQNNSFSFVAVKVVGFAGQPAVGRIVSGSWTGGALNQLTDSSGCAVFSFTNSNTFTATLSQAGYVDYYGVATPSKTASNIPASSFTQMSFTDDLAATLETTLEAPAGFALPVSLPALTLANQSLPAPFKITTAVATAVSTWAGLPPYSTVYTEWAGTCADSDPSSAQYAGSGATVTPISLDPGGAASSTVTFGAVSVRSGLPYVPGASVRATSSCGTTLSLGSLDLTGALATSLPYGTWTVSAGAASARVLVAPGGATTSAVLL